MNFTCDSDEEMEVARVAAPSPMDAASYLGVFQGGEMADDTIIFKLSWITFPINIFNKTINFLIIIINVIPFFKRNL